MRVRKQLKQEVMDILIKHASTILTKSPEVFAEQGYWFLSEMMRERERLAYMRGVSNERKKHVKTDSDTNSGS